MSTDPQPARAAPPTLRHLGVIAIGRNEGERLRRCLDAVPPGVGGVVYVDSASTDDSVEQARRRGIEVVSLDMSIPFTAARARNAGLRRLLERWPGLPFVQFLDGDCALAPGWLEAALAELASDPQLAMVCGRRREIDPGASIYNRLADMEWDTPVGEVASCGGDVLARAVAVTESGGYDERLIAGEEPELCLRLRTRGWRIRRIAHEMALHDVAMTRFRQWWRRAQRSGHGFGQLGAVDPSLYRRERRSSLFWGLALPAAALASAPWSDGLGLLLLLGYPALWLRVFLRRGAGQPSRDAALYASFCVLGKFAELMGLARYWWNRARGRMARLIEYK